jgi:galactose oxidase-like protein
MRLARIRATACAVAALSAPPLLARELSPADRAAAQAVLDRVYHEHRIGIDEPFATAVAQSVAERKVRTTVELSELLASRWQTPVTAEMLRDELVRMARGTRMPGRLRELFAALGDDPVLIQESLVRPALVARLARDRYAYDRRLHAEARAAASRLRRRLVDGSLAVGARHPALTVETLERSREDFDRRRGLFPIEAKAVGDVVEERHAFVIRAVLDHDDSGVRVATYAVAKTPWETWWSAERRKFRKARARTVARELPLPELAACDADEGWDNGSLDDLADARLGASVVWTGHDVVIWGGERGITPVNQGSRYDPATDTWSETSHVGAPSARANHSAVWTGSRMIVWGGWATFEPFQNGGIYDPESDAWAPLPTTGSATPRSHHFAAWIGSKMLVWGGDGGAGVLTSGELFDPAAGSWSPVSSLGAPSHRFSSQVAWCGSRLFVWGGTVGGVAPHVPLDDGALYDPATDTWSPVSSQGAPPSRFGGTAACAGDVAVVWGGFVGNAPITSGGLFSPATNAWAPMSSTGAPTGRSEYSSASTGEKLFIWGGFDFARGENVNDGAVYEVASDSWTPTARAGAPRATTRAPAVWTGERIVVWAGPASGQSARFDPEANAWSPVSEGNLPPAMSTPATVWTGSEMIVWGFTSSGGTMGFAYDPALDVWSPLSATGAPPFAADVAVWTGREMIVWNGNAHAGGRYAPATGTWRPMSSQGAPVSVPDRAVWARDVMVVWGGFAGAFEPTNIGGIYDPSRDVWRATSMEGAPAGRSRHAMVWTGSRVIVWGGVAANLAEVRGDGASLDPYSNTWKPISSAGAPAARTNAAAVWIGTEMLVWGGLGSLGPVIYLNNGGRFDPASDTWTPIQNDGAPVPREDPGCAWTGAKLVIWGGRFPTPGALDDGAIYDPSADAWTPMSLLTEPDVRADMGFVWSGDSIIVWSGGSGLRTGGRYVIPDGDADAVPNCTDNCPFIANALQGDADDDGIGDTCELPSMRMDFDGSGRVDGADLARLGRAFASMLGDPRYDPVSDVTSDGWVDGDDLAVLVSFFGASQ